MSAIINKVRLPGQIDPIYLFGTNDRILRKIKNIFDIEISMVGNEIWIKGNEKSSVDSAEGIFSELISMLESKHVPDEFETGYIIDKYSDIKPEEENTEENLNEIIANPDLQLKKAKVSPKTPGQAKYIEALKKHDIVFSIGPAGTGKTYLAVAMAVEALKKGSVQRIILTRPAVEAGENLGFLPGGLIEKVDPYLRPLFDAMYEMITPEKFQYLREKQIIEIAPLAYMRGRTLNNSFIILDEAQNTTHHQMKMFLTRIGFYSKVVITGDVTQIDLKNGVKSGLKECETILKNIEGINFCYLHAKDVIRHPLVKKIINAYEKFEEKE